MFSLRIQEYILTKQDFLNDVPLAVSGHPAILFCQKWFAGETAFSLQTSGSTGLPKTILLSRSQMEASAKATLLALSISKGDKALVCLNTAYIAGIMMLVRGMVGQLQLTLIEPSGNPLVNFDNTDKFDFAAMVPLQVQRILSDSPVKTGLLNNMKALIIGGAAISEMLQHELQKVNVPVYSTYGMTETVSHIALQQLRPIFQPVYQLLPDITIKTDERGCLMIKGAVTGNNWITTNDLAKIHSSATFSITGRIDNIINTGGVKIQVEKTEKVIEQIFVSQNIRLRFFIAGLEDEKLGQKVTLFIEGINDPAVSKLIASNKNLFEKYEFPKEIYFMGSFKETATEKTDRTRTVSEFLSLNQKK